MRQVVPLLTRRDEQLRLSGNLQLSRGDLTLPETHRLRERERAELVGNNDRLHGARLETVSLRSSWSRRRL
jgi:hypothetical protein